MAYRASHILVKYDGSARQASWRDPEGSVIRNRTREMAAQTLDELLVELHALGGAERALRFAELAREVSDCGTAREGGDLGVLQAGEMMEEFEEAVQRVAVGDLSEVIQTESGARSHLRAPCLCPSPHFAGDLFAVRLAKSCAGLVGLHIILRTSPEPDRAYRAMHILVKHQGAQRACRA